MNNYSLVAEAIKSRVSMRDAIAFYAPNPAPRHNRIPCPIHAGSNFNLHFSDSLFHCFVCKSGGDVIHFVQHIFDLSFPAALNKLNSDFNLALPLDRRPTLREKRDAQRRHREIMAEREKQEAEKRAYEELYNTLWDEYTRLDKNRINYAPKNIGDEFDPRYVESVKKIDYQSYLINEIL